MLPILAASRCLLAQVRHAYPYTDRNRWPAEVPQLEGAFKRMGRLIYDAAKPVIRRVDALVAAQRPGHGTRLYDASFEAGSRLVVGRLLHYYGMEQAAGDDGAASEPAAGAASACTPAPDSWCGWHNDNSTCTGLVPALWLDEETGAAVAAPPEAGLYVEGQDGRLVRVVAPVDALGFQIGEAAQVRPPRVMSIPVHAAVPLSRHRSVSTPARAEAARLSAALAPLSLARPSCPTLTCGPAPPLPARSSLEAWYTRLRTWCVATPPPAALRSSRVRRSPSSSNHSGMHPLLRRLALHMTPFSKGDQNPRSSRRCARDSALYLSLSATCFAPRAKCTMRTIIRSSWRLATRRGARSDDSYDRDACCSYTPLPSHTFRFSCAHQSYGHAVQH